MINGDGSYFCTNVFKVICCRFVLCGKGLKVHMQCIFADHKLSTYPDWGWYIVNSFPHIDAFWCLCSRGLFENIVKQELSEDSALDYMPLIHIKHYFIILHLSTIKSYYILYICKSNWIDIHTFKYNLKIKFPKSIKGHYSIFRIQWSYLT